jgi:hypothetical protein
VLDDGRYPKKAKVSDRRMRHLEDRVLIRHGQHGEWNYALRPAPAEPDPGPPGPGPDLTALAALAGIADFPALLAVTEVSWRADRERRLHLTRGGTRRKNSGGTPWALPFAAIVAAAACRQRLGMTYALLSQVLGVDASTISVAVRRIIPLLEEHGITPDPARPRTPGTARLRERAAAAGITITGMTPQTP